MGWGSVSRPNPPSVERVRLAEEKSYRAPKGFSGTEKAHWVPGINLYPRRRAVRPSDTENGIYDLIPH